jgi:putative CocE/NonD family hydrolase
MPSGVGAPLGADVFHPADRREGPVLLMRTAYGRGGFSAHGIYFASHGYFCILQETRGTSSYFHEKSDDAAAAPWIAHQPWYDGALGLFGTSYIGFTAYATAASRPAGLRAMAVSAYSADRVSAWYPARNSRFSKNGCASGATTRTRHHSTSATSSRTARSLRPC